MIAIRKGRETGIDGVSRLHEVGCAAVLRRVERYEDDRYDITPRRAVPTAGSYESRPYLRAEVEWLPEKTGTRLSLDCGAATAAAFADLEALTRRGLAEIMFDLPSDLIAVLLGGAARWWGPAGPPGAAAAAGRAERLESERRRWPGMP